MYTEPVVYFYALKYYDRISSTSTVCGDRFLPHL